MCGICGVVVAEPRSSAGEWLRAMCDALVHRGPDDEGLDVTDGVALGMRRLSIIDLETGQQPYFDETGLVRAVFNGEIYNFRQLRQDLQRRGHRFSSRADGEVIVHLWQEYGRDFVHHLNGMFAIALHDARAGRFVLARDRLGIKPLYYYLGHDQLVFASEVKALLASGLVPRGVDLDAVGQFLAWEYVPSPRTLFPDIRKLEPAGILELDIGTFESHKGRWWDVPRHEPGETESAVGRSGTDVRLWADAVDEAVGAAVRRQLVSDVPLGAFLSGGVDSSLVLAHMGPTSAFSIGFMEAGYSELPWARRVAGYLGVEHKTAILQSEMIGMFDRLMHFMDDPIADFSIFPTYLISEHARSEVTVALSGDGGDELFGGYETFVAQERARLWNRVPSFLRVRLLEPSLRLLRPRPQKKGLVNKARRFVEGLDHPESLAHARWRLFVGDALRQELFTEEAYVQLETTTEDHILALFEDAGDRPDVDRGLYVDVRSYLADNCLVKVDRMSMACSLEVRVPLLDHEIVELAFRVPPGLKVHCGATKPLLKEVAARYVPRDCVYRQKQGFSIPIKHWLRDGGRSLMEDLLAGDRLRKEGIFRSETVERLKTEHASGRENHSHVLWSLMVFQDWQERWSA